MFFPRRSHLKVTARALINIRGVLGDLLELTVESIHAVTTLRRKNRSINIGDMVIVRMDTSQRFASQVVGKTGIVVFRDSNPLWSRYSILISGERFCLSIDEIEKLEGV